MSEASQQSFNPSNREFKIANSGITIEPNSQEYRYRDLEIVMLIGLDIDPDYEEAQIQLAPGDTIVYYTDGFIDALNQHGERFGEDKLYAAFEQACQHYKNAQEILKYLFNQVEHFIGTNNSSSDDISLVVMRI